MGKRSRWALVDIGMPCKVWGDTYRSEAAAERGRVRASKYHDPLIGWATVEVHEKLRAFEDLDMGVSAEIMRRAWVEYARQWRAASDTTFRFGREEDYVVGAPVPQWFWQLGDRTLDDY